MTVAVAAVADLGDTSLSENQKKQKGRFSNMAKHYSVDEAKKVVYEYKELFDEFYIEIQEKYAIM